MRTMVLLGTSGGIPEPPCPGSVVPEWPHTWKSPVMNKKRRRKLFDYATQSPRQLSSPLRMEGR